MYNTTTTPITTRGGGYNPIRGWVHYMPIFIALEKYLAAHLLPRPRVEFTTEVNSADAVVTTDTEAQNTADTTDTVDTTDTRGT